MKTSLLEEVRLGGIDWPQYLPIMGAACESPSYKANASLSSASLRFSLFDKSSFWEHVKAKLTRNRNSLHQS